MEKSLLMTACMPSCPLMPTPAARRPRPVGCACVGLVGAHDESDQLVHCRAAVIVLTG